MKTYSFVPVLVLFFSLAGCDRDEAPSAGYPAFIDLYFDFVDTDGRKLQRPYVEMANAYLDARGNLVPWQDEFEWGHPQVSILNHPSVSFLKEETLYQDTLFGPMIVGGNMEETIQYKGQPLKRDYHYLYRFSGSDIDTLRIHSTSIITEQNHLMQGGIAVFYNGELVTSVNWLPDNADATGGVYYFENEEVVSIQDAAYPIPWILRVVKEVERTG